MWLVDGLPLHPLIVHVPVVLIPLVAAGLSLYLVVPRWRPWVGPTVAALSLVAAGAAVAATWTGDALGDALARGDELAAHRTVGEWTRSLAVLLAVGCVGLVAHDRWAGRSGRRTLAGATALLTVGAAAVTMVGITGHTGAELAWSQRVPSGEVTAQAAPSGEAGPGTAATPVPPTAEGGGSSPSGDPVVDVVLGEWALVLSTDEVPPGPTTFRFRNAGTVAHAFRIRTEGSGRDRSEWRSDVVAPGESAELTVDLASGGYDLDCPIEDGHGEHDALGMEAPLRVHEGAPPPAGPSPEQPPAPGAPQGQVAVAISGFEFSPAELRVPVGAEVTWTNGDPAPHTATGDGWDTGQLAPGAGARQRFERAGTFAYVCVLHPSMRGTVVVG